MGVPAYPMCASRPVGYRPWVGTDIETRPMGTDDLTDLGQLFSAERSTRHCWCMAFCTTGTQFATGWFRGGNQRRFATLTRTESTPMGVLASVAGEPVGWAACGPRSRYAGSPRSVLIRGRAQAENDTVWFIPCLFVSPGQRGHGVTYELVRAAVELARHEGAAAVEAWPRAGSARDPAEGFLGRERVFADVGFRPVDRLGSDRVLMRLGLTAA